MKRRVVVIIAMLVTLLTISAEASRIACDWWYAATHI